MAAMGPAERRMVAYLDRVARWNGAVNAIVALRDPDDLLAEARAADRAAPAGPLHGVPMAVKDTVRTKGLCTTWGTPTYAEHVPERDDLLAVRLRAAGAIFTGKTNVPELARGSHTFNPVYGATANPYDLARSAGGSSGGAAVALACGMLEMADGSDFMGSLRNPAGWNNVYSLRPTIGRVPQDPDGGDVFWHTLSTCGPMGRTPRDVARLLDVMSGPDPRVPLSRPSRPALPELDGATLEGLRIGYLGDWSGAFPMEAGVLDVVHDAVALMAGVGAQVTQLDAPFSAAQMWEAWCDLRAFTDAVGNRALYDDPVTRATLKPEVLWELDRGRALDALRIGAASATRSAWFLRAATLFETYDALILPTAQVWPFPLAWRYPSEIAGTPMDSYHRWMEVVVPVSILGVPAVTVPAGFSREGWPMGMQIFGPMGSDIALLRIAEAWHRLVDFAGVAPDLPG